LTEKIKEIISLQRSFKDGVNILDRLREAGDVGNETDAIRISYDFQAGSYTKLAQVNAEYIDKYTDEIAEAFSSLPPPLSIMEVGVGEATILGPLARKIVQNDNVKIFGFDISWSRARFAVRNLEEGGINASIFLADLFSIPLPDNSIDIVYTSHSLEPNGGREFEALQELYRVAKVAVVLLEPDYDRASDEAKARMSSNGYVKNLASFARQLKYNVVLDKAIRVAINPLNPTGITLIRKEAIERRDTRDPRLVCPITRTALTKVDGFFYTDEACLAYPALQGIPCLFRETAILAVHLRAFL